MKIGIGRYRVRITLRERSRADQTAAGEPTDRDLARLAQAEREYHDSLWKPQSILDGPR